MIPNVPALLLSSPVARRVQGVGPSTARGPRLPNIKRFQKGIYFDNSFPFVNTNIYIK